MIGRMPVSQKNQRFFWRARRTALHDIIKTAERRMPVSQDSSFINDYSKVKEQVIMVIEYLQQIKDSYFEQKHALEKQLNLLEIQLKENTGMIKMLEETNDSCYELFTPRNVNSKNKAKINELMEEQKTINESIENLKNSIKEYSSKIEQLDQIVEEENREIEIVQEYTETMSQQNIVSEDHRKIIYLMV